MAGDWIKMQVSLPEKPEVWQIAGALSIDADSVVGKLLRVWAWFDTHTEDGNARGVSFPLVDRVAGVAGFAEAMFLAGWLEQNGTVLTLPKFTRHNGKTGKNRALTNERVANHRKNKDLAAPEACNAESVTKTVTREEKRREEKTKRESADSRAAAASPLSRGCRLPKDWTPEPEQVAFAESLGIRNAAPELAKFRDHWAAQPGQKGVKTDWTATWRNWLRRAAEHTASKPGKPEPSLTVPDGGLAERTAALLAAQEAHKPEPLSDDARQRMAAIRQAAKARAFVPQIAGAE